MKLKASPGASWSRQGVRYKVVRFPIKVVQGLGAFLESAVRPREGGS